MPKIKISNISYFIFFSIFLSLIIVKNNNAQYINPKNKILQIKTNNNETNQKNIFVELTGKAITAQKKQPKIEVLKSFKTNRKEVAITFDDGPDPVYTPKLLKILSKYGVRATFFLIGQNAKKYPQIVKQEITEGHLVGNHTWSHPNLAKISPAQISNQIIKTENLLESITGFESHYFRPPYGNLSSQALKVINNLHFKVVLWSKTTFDYRKPSVNFIVNAILYKIKPGDIILLHDGGGNRSNSIAAADIILQKLRKQGYEFITPWEMF